MAKIKFKRYTCYWHNTHGYVMIEHRSRDVPHAVTIMLRMQNGVHRRVNNVPLSELSQPDPVCLWATLLGLDTDLNAALVYKQKYIDLCAKLVAQNIPH